MPKLNYELIKPQKTREACEFAVEYLRRDNIPFQVKKIRCQKTNHYTKVVTKFWRYTVLVHYEQLNYDELMALGCNVRIPNTKLLKPTIVED